MIKVSLAIRLKLLTIPESGMGYQVVTGKYADGIERETFILNATLAEATSGRTAGAVFQAMVDAGIERAYKSLSPSADIVDVKPIVGLSTTFKLRTFGEVSRSRGALEAPVDFTSAGETFVRFSAFEDDWRVDRQKGCLLPGSFATTDADARYCLDNQIDPISRYALPPLKSMAYVFHVEPIALTFIQRGMAEPANHQAGGGIEMFFPNGTRENTVKNVYSLEEEA